MRAIEWAGDIATLSPEALERESHTSLAEGQGGDLVGPLRAAGSLHGFSALPCPVTIPAHMKERAVCRANVFL